MLKRDDPGYREMCNARGLEYHNKRFKSDPEYKKKYFANNKRSKELAWKRDPSHRMLISLRAKCRFYKVAVNIEEIDIPIPDLCPALGIKLERGKGKVHDGSPTIDRIRPEKGYVKGNVAVISHKANAIKSNATADEILAVGNWLKQLTS